MSSRVGWRPGTRRSQREAKNTASIILKSLQRMKIKKKKNPQQGNMKRAADLKGAAGFEKSSLGSLKQES